MSKHVMLAHCYDEDKHLKKIDGWYYSVKYDGVRGYWDGKEMRSRTNHIYTIPNFISKQLNLVQDEDGNPMKLDGEIWFGNDTFAIASGAARRFENNDDVWKQMTFMVFDTPDTKLPFEERIKKLNTALKKVKDQIPNIKGVKHTRLDIEKTTIDEELAKVEQDGGEGLVLRKPGSMYIYDRSHDMLKVKSFSTFDAIVTGYVEGKGKYEGLVGSLEVTCTDFKDEEGNVKIVKFKVGSGLNDWQRFSGNPKGDWKKKEVQKIIDDARLTKKKIIVRDDIFSSLMNTIETKHGKIKTDALHKLNELYIQIPTIGDKIIFRFKELTKTGAPSFPTFVGVRYDL